MKISRQGRVAIGGFVAMLVVIVLTGCGQARMYQGAITEAAREAKNLEAETLTAAPCLIGLGAFFRLDNEDHKRGLVLLCGKGADIPEAE